MGFTTPPSLACDYGLQSGASVPYCNPNAAGLTNISGGSQTIAIVDAYDDPWAGPDLAYFSAQFGLPFSPGQFQVVYAGGNEPPEDPTGGWELEESLDIEWAHAVAPNAKIVLVEAQPCNLSGSIVACTSNMFQAVQTASCMVVYGTPACTGTPTGQGEVSMSWGLTEYSGELADDVYFTGTGPGALGQPGVVYFAAAGDSPGVSYPCASINVVCVGGITHSRMPATTPNTSNPPQQPFDGQQYGSWELTGGGSSAYEPLPTYQNVLANTLQALNNGTALTLGFTPVGVGLSTTNRAVPDLSWVANPNTGYWVWDSFDFELPGFISANGASTMSGWLIAGGTSAATPVVAAITNLAGTEHGFQTSSAAELGVLYSNINSTYPSTPKNGNIGDIPSGFGVCGPYGGYTAAPGWDPCSGVGIALPGAL
jgi:subtilase family serine protease